MGYLRVCDDGDTARASLEIPLSPSHTKGQIRIIKCTSLPSHGLKRAHPSSYLFFTSANVEKETGTPVQHKHRNSVTG